MRLVIICSVTWRRIPQIVDPTCESKLDAECPSVLGDDSVLPEDSFAGDSKFDDDTPFNASLRDFSAVCRHSTSVTVRYPLCRVPCPFFFFLAVHAQEYDGKE